MNNTALFAQATDLAADDYCVLGLATCFVRDEGEIEQVTVLEPIPSAALEALLKGVPTSYQLACAKTLGEIFQAETVAIPKEFSEVAGNDDINICDRFAERVAAATRTYKSRPEAQAHIPFGVVKQDFNYSLDRKRVLNTPRVVSTEDNVKQHSHTHKVL
ncbi:MAG: hypothetical protein RLZZ04_1210 [Cyanobacteriota bacterium]|jgi:hypothetical protein